ncbi:hypothetical protein PENSPDRAFT_692595 [Peniophora sp. CONT]|nr:hypothetical protein PENSPDRAFT_692595 [Peniophora sp. CONT]
MSDTSQPSTSAIVHPDDPESNLENDCIAEEVDLPTAVKDRLLNLTDALLGTPEVADHLLPLVKTHLIAATDAVEPRAREQLSKIDTVARFTARFAVLLSTPPPLNDWLMSSEAKRILEQDPGALNIWPKPNSPLRKCMRDVLSDSGIARPTCVRVLSDSALLEALEETDAVGEDYVAKRIAEHILKGDKAPRRAARLYAQRYADQMGNDKIMRGLALVMRGYYIWSFIRKVLPIVVDLGVIVGVASAGLPIMLAAQTCGRRVTSVVNFSFKHFCALTAL